MVLLDLPEELVALVADFVHIDSILSVALTSKETLRHMKSRLRRNRVYHERYQVQHDRKPLTVATLLRLAINNPEAASHIRAFESWGLRPGFHKWRSWEIHRPIPEVEGEEVNIDWPNGPEDYSMFDASFFAPNELELFREIMSTSLQLAPHDIEVWMERVGEGWDEPLKGILFALATKLDRLNFVAYDSWQGNAHHDTHPLTFLCTSIMSIYVALPRKVEWPPGFLSLRTISVGNPTDLRHPHDQYDWQPYEVAPLFLLPGIQTLSLRSGIENESNMSDMNLPERSSTVEHLTFSSCSDFSLQTWRTFISAPRGLKTFNTNSSIKISQDDFEWTIIELQRDSLEILSLESLPKDLKFLSSFRKLTILDSLPISGFLNHLKFTGLEPSVAAHNSDTLRSILPPSIERVRLASLPWSMANPDAITCQEISRVVMEFVTGEKFRNLKEVCLCDLMDRYRLGDFQNCWKHLAEAAAQMKANGIETHLRFLDEATGIVRDRQAHQRLHRLGEYTFIDNESDPRPAKKIYYGQ